MYEVGTRVRVVGVSALGLNVRSMPSVDPATIIGKQANFTEGVITGGEGEFLFKYHWRQVRFDTPLEGWCAQEFLEGIPGDPEPPRDDAVRIQLRKGLSYEIIRRP